MTSLVGNLRSSSVRRASDVVGRRMHGIEEEDEEDSLESVEIDSTSSFSLQECIDEFRARRIRRVSTHSRDTAVESCSLAGATADADLINQNRCNKEQERKCKPCKNGFCYCFSSDSGDAVARDNYNIRQTRRSRRSDSQIPCSAHHRQRAADSKQPRRHSAPSKLKSKQSSPHTPRENGSGNRRALTAISSIQTATSDAPLIHIIQELHDNCVISEVHVNKQKLHKFQNNTKQQTQCSAEQTSKSSSRRDMKLDGSHSRHCNISELGSRPDNSSKTDLFETSSLEKSSRSRNNPKSRNKAAGLLLQKRLSNNQIKCKSWQTRLPPPKPPRLETKASVSSLASTSVSVREAEQVLDEFLRKKGVQLPEDMTSHNNKRKSYPLYRKECTQKALLPLPTCPSLSDIERVLKPKKESDYLKNLHKINPKPRKEIQLGWTDPEISRMLNYDIDDLHNQRNYIKSKFEPAEPQTFSWQMPPKVSIDTVDGNLRQNLASNIENKHTPVKSPTFLNKNKSAGISQKFIWSEQLKNLSPWSSKKRPFEGCNLKTSSKKFLSHSKKKILRIVSPKKDNFASQTLSQRDIKLRTIGVQTSNADLCGKDVTSQTPPGSYHSPVQSSNNATTSTQNDELCEPANGHFDFSRNIKPPPRSKNARNRGRKLEFPLCSNVNSCLHRDNRDSTSTKTYRSYQADIDQDISLSKMGHLLSNIRSKLEASDNFAIRVFQEVERREHDASVRESENQPTDRLNLRSARHNGNNTFHNNYIEPIYSEIEDDSVHISSSPQYDNTTSVPVPNIDDLYAKVQKKPKNLPTPQKEHLPLAKVLQESLKNRSLHHIDDNGISNSFSSLRHVEQPKLTPMVYHSLNNINEKHSPPKKNRNLCKSDLSLQRSEIFLENLCHSEIVLDRDNSECLVKVPNLELNSSNTTSEQLTNSEDTDNVSYDLPDDTNQSSNSGDSNLGLSIFNPPESNNQSTPKKDGPTRYISKQSNLSLPEDCVNQSSCAYQQNVSSVNGEETNRLSLSALSNCKLIRNVLQRSFRTGKKILFFSPRSAASVGANARDETDANFRVSDSNSSSVLDTLLADVSESQSPTEQLSRAVSICRHMPQLEVSTAMVEAERLLLFSTLSRRMKPNARSGSRVVNVQRVWIDRMKLPVKANATQDIFFNYYFICTFECNGAIKSTQSVECHNGEAHFEDCGIEFCLSANAEDLVICCKIFMLRLRKISALNYDTLNTSKMLLRRVSSATSDSSLETLTSRFRMHASFTLNANTFVPYSVALRDEQLCLRTSNSWCLPISIQSKSSNLTPKMEFVGRAELSFAKTRHAGFLNVRDTKLVHNWNRRWCTLDDLNFAVWQDVNTPSNAALSAINLKDCVSIDISPRDLCARPRTFFLRLTNCRVLNESLVFFSAETQPELDNWLTNLRNALDFMYKWL